MQNNLYNEGDDVWMSELSCYAVVIRVRRPIGTAHYRYDVIDDDRERHDYVEESNLYPSSAEGDKTDLSDSEPDGSV